MSRRWEHESRKMREARRKTQDAISARRGRRGSRTMPLDPCTETQGTRGQEAGEQLHDKHSPTITVYANAQHERACKSLASESTRMRLRARGVQHTFLASGCTRMLYEPGEYSVRVRVRVPVEKIKMRRTPKPQHPWRRADAFLARSRTRPRTKMRRANGTETRNAREAQTQARARRGAGTCRPGSARDKGADEAKAKARARQGAWALKRSRAPRHREQGMQKKKNESKNKMRKRGQGRGGRGEWMVSPPSSPLPSFLCTSSRWVRPSNETQGLLPSTGHLSRSPADSDEHGLPDKYDVFPPLSPSSRPQRAPAPASPAAPRAPGPAPLYSTVSGRGSEKARARGGGPWAGRGLGMGSGLRAYEEGCGWEAKGKRRNRVKRIRSHLHSSAREHCCRLHSSDEGEGCACPEPGRAEKLGHREEEAEAGGVQELFRARWVGGYEDVDIDVEVKVEVGAGKRPPSAARRRMCGTTTCATSTGSCRGRRGCRGTVWARAGRGLGAAVAPAFALCRSCYNGVNKGNNEKGE
ncbi:hypothetical protein C8R44DRAFT_931136 [Mycena epipterygia]|nr:hypothetical protein C8R44DRAFT_931136 [Mycena epipterygia]